MCPRADAPATAPPAGSHSSPPAPPASRIPGTSARRAAAGWSVVISVPTWHTHGPKPPNTASGTAEHDHERYSQLSYSAHQQVDNDHRQHEAPLIKVHQALPGQPFHSPTSAFRAATSLSAFPVRATIHARVDLLRVAKLLRQPASGSVIRVMTSSSGTDSGGVIVSVRSAAAQCG